MDGHHAPGEGRVPESQERDFVLGVRPYAGALRIIFGHIPLNAMAPVLVAATLGIASAVLTESALSFLGIGVQPPTPSCMLTQGQSVLGTPGGSPSSGMAILVTVLGYNLLGEGIRDAIDPRLRQ